MQHLDKLGTIMESINQHTTSKTVINCKNYENCKNYVNCKEYENCEKCESCKKCEKCEKCTRNRKDCNEIKQQKITRL